MKKVLLSLFIFSLMIGCGGPSGEPSSINLEEYIPSDGWQKRRDNLIYHSTTQNLISGTIFKEIEKDGISTKRYFQVKEGLLNGKSIVVVVLSPELNKMRKIFGSETIEKPTVIFEVHYKNGFVYGKVKLFSGVGDILVEGQVENTKKIGDWLVFDGKELLTIPFTNNDYTLPAGTELEDDVKNFLNRNWDKKINSVYY